MQFDRQYQSDNRFTPRIEKITGKNEHAVKTACQVVAQPTSESAPKGPTVTAAKADLVAAEQGESTNFAPCDLDASGEGVQFLRNRVGTLERQVAQLEIECRVLNAELDAVTRAALSDKVVTREYIERLQGQLMGMRLLQDASSALAAQTEDTISALQAEGTQVAALIDVVQSSQFWKLKRAIQRLRARVRRR